MIGVAGACGIPPDVARECAVRDLEAIAAVASEMHVAHFGD
ncbi:hypothetical protein RBH26_20570 [Natronolimnohabitans sp. A-GB9]|nr:hypothetical protein [Natronolimnohabitans sp. A-GB9]MDQ2052839.1 hypothetical protein [Natronolimnohabitans sp. A-GB9]